MGGTGGGLPPRICIWYVGQDLMSLSLEVHAIKVGEVKWWTCFPIRLYLRWDGTKWVQRLSTDDFCSSGDF